MGCENCNKLRGLLVRADEELRLWVQAFPDADAGVHKSSTLRDDIRAALSAPPTADAGPTMPLPGEKWISPGTGEVVAFNAAEIRLDGRTVAELERDGWRRVPADAALLSMHDVTVGPGAAEMVANPPEPTLFLRDLMRRTGDAPADAAGDERPPVGSVWKHNNLPVMFTVASYEAEADLWRDGHGNVRAETVAQLIANRWRRIPAPPEPAPSGRRPKELDTLCVVSIERGHWCQGIVQAVIGDEALTRDEHGALRKHKLCNEGVTWRWPTPEAAPPPGGVGEDDDDPLRCEKCGTMIRLDDGCEPTRWCHHCAQDIAAESTDLADRVAALEKAVAAARRASARFSQPRPATSGRMVGDERAD